MNHTVYEVTFTRKEFILIDNALMNGCPADLGLGKAYKFFKKFYEAVGNIDEIRETLVLKFTYRWIKWLIDVVKWHNIMLNPSEIDLGHEMKKQLYKIIKDVPEEEKIQLKKDILEHKLKIL